MAERRQVLVLFAHPALEKSRVNSVLIEGVQDLEGVTFHDLYETYPDFDIDVPREQKLLEAHEVVLFQYPFFWYSTPSLLKEWQDLVLQHGWAYGSAGKALQGKLLLCAITTGAREEAYAEEGYNHFTIRQLLAPIEQTANLCGMDFLAPFVVHGTHLMSPEEIAAHATDYRRIVEAFRDGMVDLENANRTPRLNANLSCLLRA